MDLGVGTHTLRHRLGTVPQAVKSGLDFAMQRSSPSARSVPCALIHAGNECVCLTDN